MGRGSRQMVNSDKYGFPRGKAKAAKYPVYMVFRPAIWLRRLFKTAKRKETYVGTVSIRTTGSFKINGKCPMVLGGATAGLSNDLMGTIINIQGALWASRLASLPPTTKVEGFLEERIVNSVPGRQGDRWCLLVSLSPCLPLKAAILPISVRTRPRPKRYFD